MASALSHVTFTAEIKKNNDTYTYTGRYVRWIKRKSALNIEGLISSLEPATIVVIGRSAANGHAEIAAAIFGYLVTSG